MHTLLLRTEFEILWKTSRGARLALSVNCLGICSMLHISDRPEVGLKPVRDDYYKREVSCTAHQWVMKALLPPLMIMVIRRSC